jgi:hypothetical protein
MKYPMFVYWLFLFVGLHSFSFMMELMYQKLCYPITFSGFITSMFTQTSLLCTLIREVSNKTHIIFYDGMLFLCFICLSKLTSIINEYKKYIRS